MVALHIPKLHPLPPPHSTAHGEKPPVHQRLPAPPPRGGTSPGLVTEAIPDPPGAHLLGVLGDDAALLRKQRAGEWSATRGRWEPGRAAHRGQQGPHLVGPQRLVADAAVVGVLKSDAE